MESHPAPSLNVFRHRDFAVFWWARMLSNLALAAESVTIGWQVYAVARDRAMSVEQGAFLVGMVGLVQFIPVFCLTLTAGETADRYDRRKLMVLCMGIEILCVMGLGVLALHPSPSLLPVFAAAAIFGAARAFLAPASSAMGPMLVPREELPRAVAWNSLAWQGAAVLGPSIGGLLISISPAVAFFTAGGLYTASVLCMTLIKGNTRPVRQAGSRAALIREGIAYVWTNKIVLGAISLDLFAVLLGGATALLPVFARDILKVGPDGFGLLRAAPAVGAGLVAFTLARRPIQRHAGHWMFAGVAAFGAATLVFAISRSMIVSMIALAALGAADMISVFIRQSLVQIVTPDHMRGRVGAVSNLFIGASNELGEFESGVVARLLGPVGAALFGGVGSLIVTGLWSRLFPALRTADRLDRPEETPEVSALRYDFASDNVAGAAPEAMEALIAANAGAASGYGSDSITREAADAVRSLLDTDAEVRFVYSGTAANAVALSALARPFEAVAAHVHAHVVTDEAGAPQAFGAGLALLPLPGLSGKIDPAALDALLQRPEEARFQPPAALSLTQATEYGTVYAEAELERLIGLAKARGLGVHLDGARLANTVAAGFDPKRLGPMGVDMLVVGGTKAGMPPTEALVVFDKALQKRLDLRLKQQGQLASKARFLSAPWIGMLKSGAWTARAAHANAMARRLAAAIPFPAVHPVEANLVFVALDDERMARLRAAGWAVYRGADGSARLMCSWATTPELVDEFAAVIAGL